MEPGMSHCQGGDGPSNFDMLSALEQWVEQGQGAGPDCGVAYDAMARRTVHVRCVRIRRLRFIKERGVPMMLRTSRVKSGSLSRLCALALRWRLPRPRAAAASCESLSSLNLPDTTITAAEAVAAGAFAPPARGPRGRAAGRRGIRTPICRRFAGSPLPSSLPPIPISRWKSGCPPPGWNNKFEADGNGAWTGRSRRTLLPRGSRPGYATSMTDTGHEGGSASFALGHPEKQIDFGYRAVHELAVKSKAIIAALLRPGSQVFVLEWLLGRRQTGLEGSADVPRRFRRHHRGHSGERLGGPGARRGVDGAGDA